MTSIAEAPRLTLIDYGEVLKHNKRDDCWVVRHLRFRPLLPLRLRLTTCLYSHLQIINGEVYDVTNFIATHPGGVNAILKMAGKDAT